AGQDGLDVIRAPGNAVGNDVEAGFPEAPCEYLEVALRIGHVRPRNVDGVPEVDLDGQLQPGLTQKRPRPGRVIAVPLHVLRVADEGRRQELAGELTAPPVERTPDSPFPPPRRVFGSSFRHGRRQTSAIRRGRA